MKGSVRTPAILNPVKAYLRYGLLATAALVLGACHMVVTEPMPVSSGAVAGMQQATLHAGGRVTHGEYHVVNGDTLYSIAARNRVDVHILARWNNINAPYTIHTGQVLRLSPARSISTPVAKPARPDASSHWSATPPETTARSGHSTNNAAPTSVFVTGGRHWVQGINWQWPASGRLIKRFRPRDAIPSIAIAGSSGTPVLAAANGTVVYSGNGLVGYGQLVIVKHNKHFLSVYSHNRKRLVHEGQHVTAGQQIAQMGSTGTSRNELEFQIRKNGNPVDPLDYLPLLPKPLR